MSLRLRRFIYIFFILIFLAFIPVVLFYAHGYRFDFKRDKMVKTGSLIVNSFPISANVYLNGYLEKISLWKRISARIKDSLGLRKLGGTTPTIFHNLIPDDYEIMVKKDNYQSWSKKLPVEGGKVTFAEDIFLFLENPKINNLVKEDIVKYQLSADNKKIAYITKSTEGWRLKYLNLEKENSNPLYSSPSPLEIISWSFSNKKLLVKTQKNKQNEYLIFDLSRPQEIFSFTDLKTTEPDYLNKKININLADIKWDFRNDDILYGLYNNAIFQVNLFNKKIGIIIDPQKEIKAQVPGQKTKISDFIVKEDSIYYIISRGEATFLEKKKMGIEEEAELINELPYSLNYIFTNPQNEFLNIFETKEKIIRIIDPKIKNSPEGTLLKFFANEAAWSEDNKRLLYFDDFELGYFTLLAPNDTKVYEKEVLSRYSQTIKDALWYLEDKYIIFNLNNTLYTIEMDSRDKRNTVKVLETNQIDEILMHGNKEFIYLIGKYNNEKGIFRVKIQ